MEAPKEAARLAAIVAQGRATRRRPSRAAWIAASIVGAACAIGFLLLALDGTPGERPGGGPAAPPRAASRGAGCAGGFGAGLGLGVAIGFALGARRPQADHSSRRSP